MRIETGKIEGDARIEHDLTLQGMITGTTVVEKGAVLELHGMCCNGLTVENDSTAIVYGTVVGNVINNGGDLSVYGTVNGDVITNAGETEIDGSAIVAGSVWDKR